MSSHALLVTIQRPTGLDLADTGAVRRWVQDVAVRERAGAIAPPALWFFSEDADGVRLERVEAPEPEARDRVLSFAFAQWGERVDVRRRFWLGDTRRDVPGGARRALCVMESFASGEWWTAEQLVRYDSAARVGVALGDWIERSGQATSVPGEPYVGWLAPERAHALSRSLRLAMHERTWAGPRPRDAASWLTAVGWPLLFEVIGADGGDAAQDAIATVSGDRVRLWQWTGALPCRLDDLVRTLALDDEAEVVVAVCAQPAEAGARRWQLGAEWEDQRATASAWWPLGEALRRGAVAQAEGARARLWLGVLPVAPVALRLQQAAVAEA